MGLLNMLIKKTKKEATKMAVNAIFDEIGKNAQNKAGVQSAGTTQTANYVQPAVSSAPQTVSAAKEKMKIEDKLDNILREEFPQYQVQREVSPVTLGGNGQFRPYSYGIYANGAPKLFIMLVDRNTCATRLYKCSKDEAARAGVPMINFVRHFENNLDYVRNRLHQYL